MGNPRRRPERLATKLLAIRQTLRLSQSQMAQLLNVTPYQRISEYENGRREPILMVLLRYARTANVSVECLIDDELEITWPAS